MISVTDLRIEKELERDLIHQRIIVTYCKFANEASDFKPGRIITALAAEFGMTSVGIRNILIKNNIITTKSPKICK